MFERWLAVVCSVTIQSGFYVFAQGVFVKFQFLQVEVAFGKQLAEDGQVVAVAVKAGYGQHLEFRVDGYGYGVLSDGRSGICLPVERIDAEFRWREYRTYTFRRFN